MIGIIFATEKEAKPFLKSIRAFRIRKCPFLIFKSLNRKILPCVMIISGIGKVAAAVATAELIHGYNVEFVVNAGICGAINDDLPTGIGGIYRISKTLEVDRALSGSVFQMKVFETIPFFDGLGLREAILVTSDKSVFDDSFRYNLSAIGDLVDMEGAAIARVADMYSVGYDLIKGVSDLASRGAVEIMKANLDKVSLSISVVLLLAIRKMNV